MPALMEILQSNYILAQVPQDHGPGLAHLTSPRTASRGKRKDLCLLSSGPDLTAFSYFTVSFIQVQAIRLLSSLAQKNDLLYDILNCQVRKELKRSWWILIQKLGKEESWILQTDLEPTRLSCSSSCLCTRYIENHSLFYYPNESESILLGGEPPLSGYLNSEKQEHKWQKLM